MMHSWYCPTFDCLRYCMLASFILCWPVLGLEMWSVVFEHGPCHGHHQSTFNLGADHEPRQSVQLHFDIQPAGLQTQRLILILSGNGTAVSYCGIVRALAV
jgi:hypothetical protein